MAKDASTSGKPTLKPKVNQIVYVVDGSGIRPSGKQVGWHGIIVPVPPKPKYPLQITVTIEEIK